MKSDVKIISARTMYDKLYPNNPMRWKIEAFLSIRADMRDVEVSNLIVLGDSVFEMEAARILGKQFNKAYIKTIKFRQSPKMSEMIKQINFSNK